MNIEQIKTTDHVTTLNGLPGMSSQEIAEITGKRHDHILRDIRKMLGALELIDAPKSGEVRFVEAQYRDAKGQSRPLTVLDKELTFTLLSRYSFKLSNQIVKRWLELEGAGFERVSVQATIHALANESQERNAILRSLNNGRRRALTVEQKERKKHQRRASQEANNARRQGKESH